MGCTESMPAPSELDATFQQDDSLPPLYKATVSSSSKTQIIVREKFFSWSGDTFKIKTRDGQLFGNGICVKGKTFAWRDQMALLDGNGNAIAVCLRKFELIGQTFKIYTMHPLYPGQEVSDRKYNDSPLYTYCKVERAPFSTEQQVTMANQKHPSFTIHRVGGLWPKKRVVRLHGKTAALMEGGTWEGNWNSYLLTINPGIDPCLIVCLTAICDEMDEGEK